MNLAEEAPKVEKAHAEAAPRGSVVKVEMVTQSEPTNASPAPKVVSARVVDPQVLAPPSHATTTTLSQAQQSLSVEALRANAPNGRLDLESYAAVIAGPAQKNFFRRCLPCIFDERDFVAMGEVKYYVAVSGKTCFVYAEDTSQAPYYAIDLRLYDASQEDANHPHPQSHTISPAPDTNKPRPSMVTILLKKQKTDTLAYQVTFDTEHDKTLAKRFLDLAQQAKSESKKEEEVVVGELVEKKENGKDDDVAAKKAATTDAAK